MSPGTKKRGIRIPDELWARFQEATTAAGVNASEQIRRLIQEWTTKQRNYAALDTISELGSDTRDWLDNNEGEK